MNTNVYKFLVLIKDLAGKKKDGKHKNADIE